MSIDSKLLERNRVEEEEESRYEGEVRKGKKKNRQGSKKKKDKESQDDKKSVRQRLSKRKEKTDEKSDKEKSGNVTSSFGRKGSKMALRWSWITLLVTGGFSILFSWLYLNIHAFSRFIFPNLVCKFGDEWAPSSLQSKDAASQSKRRALGLIEVLGLIFLNCLVLTAIIFFISTFVVLLIVFGWIFEFWDMAVDWFSGLFD